MNCSMDKSAVVFHIHTHTHTLKKIILVFRLPTLRQMRVQSQDFLVAA